MSPAHPIRPEVVSIEYGYDHSSNRTFAYDARFQSGRPMNHLYTNDPLNRLTAAMRNTRANLTGGTPTNGPDNTIGWDGYVFNAATGDYLVRHRTYRPPLGRWGERDPIGQTGGINLFGHADGISNVLADPAGVLGAPPAFLPSLLGGEGGAAAGTAGGTAAAVAGGALLVAVYGYLGYLIFQTEPVQDFAGELGDYSEPGPPGYRSTPRPRGSMRWESETRRSSVARCGERMVKACCCRKDGR